jgi:subtilisin family serine protease
MKINSVKFKDKKSFDKNKKKSNVLSIHEPFGIIVFEDKTDVIPDTAKVSQSNEINSSEDQISTGLAIVIAKNHGEATNYFRLNGIVVKDSYELTKTFFVEVPDFISFDSFYGSLMSTGIFISVEPDYIVPMDMDAETVYNGHWHLPNMKAAEAWSLLTGDNTGEVAVLDIACETGHEDLQGALSSLSWNCVTDGPDVNPISDYENHGTSCTGVIAAVCNNNVGSLSLGNNKLKVQFLHIGYNSTSGGSFQTSDTIVTRAINKAIANPKCYAISMSWGGTGNYPIFVNALNTAKTVARNGKGIPIFASSGNQNNPSFTQNPAAYPSVMAIGASTSTNTRANFSNYGPKTFAAAPGVSLWTVDRTGPLGYGADSYKGFSGTSASCPAMAAVAAAVLVKNPELTEMQVRDILKNSCRKTGGYVYNADGWSNELGYGVIDMFAAVTQAAATLPGEPTPGPTHNYYGAVSSPATVQQGSVVNVVYSVMSDKPVTNDTVVPVLLSFKRADNASLNFYTGTVTILAGQTSASATIPYTVPNTFSGVCQFVLTVDPNNFVQETNENDNVAMTSINVTLPPAPTEGVDLLVKIESYEFLDSTRVRIRYTFSNVGKVDVVSLKATAGFDGKPATTWTRTELYRPGTSKSMASVFPSNMWGTLPNTFRIKIIQVNGVADANASNNESSIIINPR